MQDAKQMSIEGVALWIVVIIMWFIVINKYAPGGKFASKLRYCLNPPILVFGGVVFAVLLYSYLSGDLGLWPKYIWVEVLYLGVATASYAFFFGNINDP